jgi:hypothetical protein
LTEADEDGTDHLIGRAMNLVEAISDSPLAAGNLADRLVNGHSQPGVYRVIVNLNTWTLLKWLDDPCPFFDWHAKVEMHPEDREHFAERMRAEFADGTTTGVLRLPANGGGWVPLHVMISRVELEDGVTGGLATLRLPTANELADVGLDAAGRPLV